MIGNRGRAQIVGASLAGLIASYVLLVRRSERIRAHEQAAVEAVRTTTETVATKPRVLRLRRNVATGLIKGTWGMQGVVHVVVRRLDPLQGSLFPSRAH